MSAGTSLARLHSRRAGSGPYLCIVGDLKRLGVLAANLRETAEMQDGGHLHVDHFPGHPYLAPGSISLVVNSATRRPHRAVANENGQPPQGLPVPILTVNDQTGRLRPHPEWR
jgi:hypothetical protein